MTYRIFLLLRNVVPPQKIPEGCTALNGIGNPLAVMARNKAAQALNADSHPVQIAGLFRSIGHSQRMGIFHAPAVDHIGFEFFQLPAEPFLQFRQVLVGQFCPTISQNWSLASP